MLELFKNFTLQLFADGDGGGESSSDGAEATAGVEIPSSVPARARENYRKAVESNTVRNAQPEAKETTEADAETTEAPAHIPYSELIKSDEYKEEHRAWTEKTLNDRLKKYKGIENELAQTKELLSLVGQKYGLDGNSESFMTDIAKSIEDDDSYYENYAMEHDISPQEARKIVTLERKVAANDRREEEARRQEQQRMQIMQLQQNAERTKQMFPNFDLNTEMQDEQFRRLVAATNGDTTAAYRTRHWNEIIPQTMQMASQQAAIQTANAVKANKSRPVENGLAGSAPSVTTQKDFSKMNLNELRAYAEEQRRAKR